MYHKLMKFILINQKRINERKKIIVFLVNLLNNTIKKFNN